MNVLSTFLAGVYVVDMHPFQDDRGTFTRFYCEDELSEIIGSRRILQINHSRTHRVGAVRGMHYQKPPNAEMKLVRCIKGRVWDVVVDLRTNSPTFLNWYAEELSAENTRMMVIPEGCAHGFQVLDADSELLYLHTALYQPDLEDGLAYNDRAINISWPLATVDLSTRDQNYPTLRKGFSGIVV